MPINDKPTDGQREFMRQNGLTWEHMPPMAIEKEMKYGFGINLPLDEAFALLKAKGIQHISLEDITYTAVDTFRSEHLSNGFHTPVLMKSESEDTWNSVTLKGRG